LFSIWITSVISIITTSTQHSSLPAALFFLYSSPSLHLQSLYDLQLSHSLFQVLNFWGLHPLRISETFLKSEQTKIRKPKTMSSRIGVQNHSVIINF
jgi:hypothetical protein